MVTYIPYILIEFVSNYLLKVIGPRYVLPGLCMAWGTVTTFQCLIHNYNGLLVSRFFLGLSEGGLFPGFILYLTDFYKRQELQKRIGIIYAAASISGAFSGLLAAAIENLDGVGGLAGWRWIFLLEGAAAVAFGFLVLFVMPNSPQKVLFFKPHEAEYCQQRLLTDSRVQENPRISMKAVLSTLKELHVLNLAVIGFCNGIVLGGVSYFTPSIVQALGYGRTQTQLLSVPPYACALVFTMIAAFLADKYGRRGLVSLATLSLALLGCILNLTCTSIGVRYAAQCLLVTGCYSTSPSLLTWLPNNVATYGRRATAVAMVFVTTNGAGMVAMWLYPTKTAPRYLFATKFNLVTLCVEMVCIAVQIILLKRLNEHKLKNRNAILQHVTGLPHDEQMEILGDRHPDFIYVL